MDYLPDEYSARTDLFRESQPRSRARTVRQKAHADFIDAINSLPLVITAIVSTKGENIHQNYPTNVPVTSEESGLPLETVFLCFQIRSLDPTRFPAEPAGQLSADKMHEVETAVRYCLGL
jgi:mRNA interferase MazF